MNIDTHDDMSHDIEAGVSLMAVAGRARVFMSGRSQAVRIPVKFRLKSEEVLIRRDKESRDLILLEGAGSWKEIFAALDRAGVPDDFLEDRRQGMPQVRDDL